MNTVTLGCTCTPTLATWEGRHITSCPIYRWSPERRYESWQTHYRQERLNTRPEEG